MKKLTTFDEFLNESTTNKPDWHKLHVGDEIYLYVKRAKDGSGSSTGRSVTGEDEYVTKCIFQGQVGNGSSVFQADFADDKKHIGMPISDDSIVPYSVLKKLKLV